MEDGKQGSDAFLATNICILAHTVSIVLIIILIFFTSSNSFLSDPAKIKDDLT